jgi:hypothetical protein
MRYSRCFATEEPVRIDREPYFLEIDEAGEVFVDWQFHSALKHLPSFF